MAAMETNNAPDSWDQDSDGGSGDKDNVNQLSNNFSGLNVNAAPFIPGQNVYAKEFVPSFQMQSPSKEGNTIECLHSQSLVPIITIQSSTIA